MLNLLSRFTLKSVALITVGWCYASPALVHAATPSFTVQSAAQDNSQAGDLTGSWQLSWTDEGGNAKQGTINIKQDGGKLSGTFSGQRGSFPLAGTLEGNHVTLTIGPSMRHFTLEGEASGSKLSGTTPQGKEWSASRQ